MTKVIWVSLLIGVVVVGAIEALLLPAVHSPPAAAVRVGSVAYPAVPPVEGAFDGARASKERVVVEVGARDAVRAVAARDHGADVEARRDSELAVLKRENERLERLLAISQSYGDSPYGAFLASPDADEVPEDFHAKLERFLDVVPIFLAPGEPQYLHESWETWAQGPRTTYLEAVWALGPTRLYRELSSEQLYALWCEFGGLEELFELVLPEVSAELAERYAREFWRERSP